MPRRNGFVLFIALVLAISIVNCSNTPHHPSIPAISGPVPNTGSVDIPYSGVLTVTGGVAPFTWMITGVPNPPFTQTFSGNTATISGTPTATATISGSATVTDSKGNSSAAFPFTITITAAPTLAITPTTLTFMVGTAVNQVLTVSPATVGPYTWNIDAGALPPGSPALVLGNGTTTDPKTIQTTTNTVTITGTPNTAGSFPFTITVTDSAPTPNFAQASYPAVVSAANASACPAGTNNAALPAGTTYAFLLKGFDSLDEPIVMAGSFTTDGLGGITAGDVDFNGFTNGPQEAGTNLDTADSTYSFDLNNDTRGCLSLVINTGGAAKLPSNHKVHANAASRAVSTSRRAIKREGVAPPPPPPLPSRIVFQFALGGKTAGIYTTGNIIEFDNADGSGTSASGVMHVQDPTAFDVTSLAPNFAFGASGWDPLVDRVAIAGSFTLTDGVINPIFADFNDNGTLSGELNGSANSGVINPISPTSTTGRTTGSFDIPKTPGPDVQFDSVVYIINANDFYVISADNPATSTTSLLSGRALATSSTFPAGALNGFSLFASEGFDPNFSTNVVSVGTAQFSSTGTTATAAFFQSDNGTVTTPTFNGTYTVDTTNPSSGRVSFAATGTATPPVVYLTNGGDGIEQIQGFSVGQDTATTPTLPIIVSGILVTQSATAPDFTSLSGTYAFGSWEDIDAQNGSFSGTAIFTAPTTYSAIQDQTFVTLNAPFLTPLPQGASVPGTFTIIPAGTGTITVGTNTNAFVTNGQQIFSIAPGTNTSGPDAFLATYTNVVGP